VGYDDLRKINPELVFCSITGYGSKGPWRQRPGYDCIAASVGGLMNATGDAVPAKVAVPVTDLMTGMYAHGAILAALRRGVGDKIDCDLLSTQLAMMFNLGSNYLNAGTYARTGVRSQSVPRPRRTDSCARARGTGRGRSRGLGVSDRPVIPDPSDGRTFEMIGSRLLSNAADENITRNATVT